MKDSTRESLSCRGLIMHMKPLNKSSQKLYIVRLIAAFTPVLVLISTALTGCARNTEPISRTGFYFDTVIQITLYDTEDTTILDGCFALAEKYENLFSATKEGSDVWKINHAGGETVTVSEETVKLLIWAADYANTTEGRIDPTIRPVSALWNFGSDNEPHVPEDAAIKRGALPRLLRKYPLRHCSLR